MIVARLFRGHEWLERSLVPDKHISRLGRRPAVPEVGDQGVSDVGEQRQGEDAAGLGLGERQHVLPPVDGIEAELPEVARTQAVPGREQQDGIVTTADGRRAVHAIQKGGSPRAR